MIDVRDHKELQAVVLAMKRLEPTVKKSINAATRDTLNPVWKSLVAVNATSEFDSKLLVPGTRIAAGNPPRAVAASSVRGIGESKRLKPATDFWMAEFGGRSNKTSTYTRKSKNGGTHKVTRRTRAGLPQPIRKGRAVYPAFAEIAPRAVSLWTQIVILETHNAFEGKG
ncbi:hypothetical protein ACFWGN_20685 [Oerskovia sp. NPDC060338]|uniref:hypothetical protein n=1 Tax=Oerskovia sp. NPDC060338 TaxID=3347100 RepID=UPI0036628B8C